VPRTAKVFMTNRSQALRLPKEYQFSTAEVFIRKGGRGRHPVPLGLATGARTWNPRRPRATLSWLMSTTCRFRSARRDATLYA
jgi:hypothetical protein